MKNQTYKPKPLKTFIIRDPKTRKISKSAFRDRVVHHALCDIIEPIFEKSFIYDSYANRKGKGTLEAIKRFDYFKKKVSENNTKTCFVLKADIKHYFEEVNHKILLNIVRDKIKDEKFMELINKILKNYKAKTEGKGMPLGNLTSQFFANVYLNELDYFVKSELKAKFYIRYVDDFVILDKNKEKLWDYKTKINKFLQNKLKIELHPDKSKILCLENGVNFLGLRIFYHHKLVKKTNLRKFQSNFKKLKKDFSSKKIDYDKVYDSLEGWLAYAKNANAYKLRKEVLKEIEKNYPNKLSTKEINRIMKKSRH